MRIIAGQYRRRKLRSNPGLTTRPITDRAKEILFERLGDRLEGAHVADVFAGTGTIGLEALSRGAASCIFIEKDRKASELLKSNVEMLGAEGETLCWSTDVLRTSFRPQGVDWMLPYDVVFFDPPFKFVADVVPGTPLTRSLQRLARETVTADDVLLLFRTPVDVEFEMPAPWQPTRTIELSNMVVHGFGKAAA